jgi:hypothetical protein
MSKYRRSFKALIEGISSIINGDYKVGEMMTAGY